MKTVITTLAAASLLVIAGCSTQRPISQDFGNSTQQNFAVQIANPEVSTKAPTHDGAYTADAVNQYRKGLAPEPTAEKTTGRTN